jgi:hypothetical protein
MNPLACVEASSSRMGSAVETFMYIGVGTLLLVVLLFIFLR